MGAFPIMRHNEIRDLTAKLLSEVCHVNFNTRIKNVKKCDMKNTQNYFLKEDPYPNTLYIYFM